MARAIRPATSGSSGRPEWSTRSVGADALQPHVDGVLEPPRARRRHDVVLAGPQADPARPRDGPHGQAAEQVTVRRELLARRRALVGGQLHGQLSDLGAVVRGPERDDSPGLGRAAEAGGPEPRHHPARRVPDDVDRRRPALDQRAHGRLQRPCLGREVARAVAHGPDDAHVAPGRRPQLRGQPFQRARAAAVAGQEQHGAGPLRSGCGRGGRPGGLCAVGQAPDGEPGGDEHDDDERDDQHQAAAGAHERAPGGTCEAWRVMPSIHSRAAGRASRPAHPAR